MLGKALSCKSYLFLFATEYLISAVLMVKGIDSRGQLHTYTRIPRMAVYEIKSIRFSVQFYHSDISIGYLHETEGELMALFCPIGPHALRRIYSHGMPIRVCDKDLVILFRFLATAAINK